jgi:hypothetical protein
MPNRIKYTLCDSCDTAAYDEGMGNELFMDEIMAELGGEIADHLCDEIETDGEARCGCGCHWRLKRSIRKGVKAI